jgi:hypothetical protein
MGPYQQSGPVGVSKELFLQEGRMSDIDESNAPRNFLDWCGLKGAEQPPMYQIGSQALLFATFFLATFFLVVFEALLKPAGTAHSLTFLVWVSAGLLLAFGALLILIGLPGLAPGITPKSYEDRGGPEVRAVQASSPATFRETALFNAAVVLGMLDLAAIAALSGGTVGSPFGQLLIAFFIFGQLLAPRPRATIAILFIGIMISSLVAVCSHAIGNEVTHTAWTSWYYAGPLVIIGGVSTWISHTQVLAEAGKRREEVRHASTSAES